MEQKEMSVLLEKEYKFFLSRLDEFIPGHQNKFVLIKGRTIVDFYNSYEEALEAGLKNFGNVHFFHQGIVSDA